MLPKIIIIAGATASGKTQLGLTIARAIGAEIINADSRQLYRGLDIASGKEIANDVWHHLFDLVSPDESFSLGAWLEAAHSVIGEIHRRDRTPIVVGGTVLYLHALVENMELPAVAPQSEFRQTLQTRNVEDLFLELEQLDPKTATVIERKNRRRLIRALEVVQMTGKSFTELGRKGERRYQTLTIGWQRSQEELDQRIEQRVAEMFARGLLAETKVLLQKYRLDLPALSGIGYAEVALVLEGKIGIEEAQEQVIRRTKKYARRQLAFLKKIPDLVWIQNEVEALTLVKEFLKKS